MADMLNEWMISVDDHLIEPPNVWVDRLPGKYKELGPRWINDEQGEAWLVEGSRRVPINGAVVAGAFWPPEAAPPLFQPLAWSEIPAPCYDPTARREAMDADQVLAMMPFPNLPGFAGRVFQHLEDKELGLLCIQAYNDWILDEYAAAIPGRVIGLALIPMWDGTLAAREAERVIAKGARAVAFSMAPENLDLPPIADSHWEALFSVMAEADLPLCAHLGSGERGGDPGLQGDVRSRSAMQPANVAVGLLAGAQSTLADWLTSGNFERHPNLKLALSENGIGWIPAVLQEADRIMQLRRSRITVPTDPENDALLTDDEREQARLAIDERAARAQQAPLPSEMFREHVYGCFIKDAVGLKLVDEIGVDNIMIESDFPHSSTSWPHSIEKAAESLAKLDEQSRWKILRGNAERVFHFTAPPVPD
jgi:predicted TIM-barrel fold metal-dependent hydrolase